MNKFIAVTLLLSFALLLDFGSSTPQSESEDGAKSPNGSPPNGPPPNRPPPNGSPPNGPPPNRPPPNGSPPNGPPPNGPPPSGESGDTQVAGIQAIGQAGVFKGRLHAPHKGVHHAGCRGSTTTAATTTTTAASG